VTGSIIGHNSEANLGKHLQTFTSRTRASPKTKIGYFDRYLHIHLQMASEKKLDELVGFFFGDKKNKKNTQKTDFFRHFLKKMRVWNEKPTK